MRFDRETKEMLLTTIVGGISEQDLGGDTMTLNVHFVTLWRGRHTYEAHGDILCYTSMTSAVPKILVEFQEIIGNCVNLSYKSHLLKW